MFAEREGECSLWVREPEVCAAIREGRENRAFLPGVKVPEGVHPTTDLGEALAGRTIVALAVPSPHLRDVAGRCGPPLVRGATVASLAKGLENGTLLRMTEVLGQVLPASRARLAVLSGPTLPREVAGGRPSGAGAAGPRSPAWGSGSARTRRRSTASPVWATSFSPARGTSRGTGPWGCGSAGGRGSTTSSGGWAWAGGGGGRRR